MKTRQHPDASIDQEDTASESKIAEAWSLAKYSSVGIEVAIAITVGLFSGLWLDAKLGTSPWLMFVFFILGVIAAFKGLMRAANEISKKL